MSKNQFKSQFTNVGKRQVILNRLEFFCEAIHSWGRDKKTLRILDVGCGSGISVLMTRFAIESLPTPPNCTIVGMELDHDRLGHIAGKFTGNPGVRFSFLRGDGLTLPFDKKSFDLIVLNQVIEHLSTPEPFLRSLRSLLTADGKLLLTTPNEGCLMGWLRNHIFHRKILRQDHHLQYFTRNSLETLLAEAGFTIQKFQTHGFFYPTLSLHRRMRQTNFRRKLSELMGALLPEFSGDLMAFAERGQ